MNAVQNYRVRSGDTLTAIAERNGVSPEALMRANGMDPAKADGRVTQSVRDPDRLQVGQKLLIPVATQGLEREHQVAPGETLLDIAERWGVTLKDLLAANPLLDAVKFLAELARGPQAAPPDPGEQAATTAQRTATGTAVQQAAAPLAGHANAARDLRRDTDPVPGTRHTVQAGETLAGIARQHGLTLAQVLEANPQIRNPDRIQVGQQLNLSRQAMAPGNAAAPRDSIAPAGNDGHARGELSSRYETGGRGPGTVSTGRGDSGGVSYGSYQLATNRGRPTEFLQNEGQRWADRFAGHAPGSAGFSAVWRQIAAESPQAFQQAQHQFIERTHYTPMAQGLTRRTGMDINDRSAALQDVVWSTAVQHGPGSRIIDTAIRQVDARMDRSDAGYDRALIQAIYAERGRRDANGELAHFSRNSAAVQQGVADRFVAEQADALRMLQRETGR